jgi:hypothetical protein
LEGLTFDVDDLDLIEAAPASSMPVSAKAIVAPSSAKSNARGIRLHAAEQPQKKSVAVNTLHMKRGKFPPMNRLHATPDK